MNAIEHTPGMNHGECHARIRPMAFRGFHGVLQNHGMRGVHGKHGKDRCHRSSCLVMGYSLQ